MLSRIVLEENVTKMSGIVLNLSHGVPLERVTDKARQAVDAAGENESEKRDINSMLGSQSANSIALYSACVVRLRLRTVSEFIRDESQCPYAAG
jgi:hypothetical protein